MLTDRRGVPVTAASAEAVAALDRAIDEYLAFGRNAGRHLKAAQSLDPDMPLAHCLRGYFFLLMSNAAVQARVDGAVASARAAAVNATSREKRHVAALEAWTRQDLRRAIALWEDILLDHPLDVLALKLAHFHHFYLGEVRHHRDSVARVMPAWARDVPGYGYVLGMRAFGLEEAGDYEAAERIGREAVEINPADTWAIHAVTHVMEMNGRQREGIDWIRLNEDHWENKVHNFAFHVWWHQALFHLDLDQPDAVLELYDNRFRADPTDDYLDISNAASVLLRLDLRGIDVGRRWQEVAEIARDRTSDHLLPFADLHYMMALAESGRNAKADELLGSMRRYGDSTATTYSQVVKEVALPVAEAIYAFGCGEYGRVVDLMMPVRYGILRVGGSHAQRDVFHLLLLEAALRAGRWREARALAAERVALKPRSADAWRAEARALDGLGDADGARRARSQVDKLVRSFVSAA